MAQFFAMVFIASIHASFAGEVEGKVLKMEKLNDFFRSLFNQLSSWLEMAVNWFSANFFPLLFEVSYYLGVGTGILIGAIIFSFFVNKILTYLTFRHEISALGVVPDPPVLTEVQKKLLKETLFWWNKQCDSWYMTSPACVDKALTGKKINLIDVQRISDSTQVGKDHQRFVPSKETQKLFDDFQKSLMILDRKLQHEVDYKKLNYKLVKETDILSKQLKIAQYSALAAVASAIATGFLTYLTYMKM